MKTIITIATVAILASTTCQAGQDNSNITDWQKTRFKQLDLDNNGSLNVEEMRGTTKEWMTKAGFDEAEQVKRTSKKLAKLDTNKDKSISLDEFAADHNKQKKKK
ncbi:EF-hand domain-containing protein [Thalassotalea nanhaiensis]|uniref:EF-hand domain-containing protein n=1 Tax=Thalassotalea nanhaiensis TaxID=3065648 RepID=A0ABY9TK89_9GAMM|nr:EF-hand domain-containing protein [Colwelliaceae bacterium SQ345]